MDKNKFGDFLLDRQKEYSDNAWPRQRRSTSQAEYVRALNAILTEKVGNALGEISPQSFNTWTAQVRPPDEINLLRLSIAIGPEVWKAADRKGIDTGSIEALTVIATWGRLSEEDKDEIMRVVQRNQGPPSNPTPLPA
jgi:hypothetical protein